ncbi:phage tail tape measure protein, partial [Pseudonocardia sp. McavD-2-B]|uniref:phage tail tape measure protein n=1 Tax=Pseudonocardia sp. McavD-2-B TaxID=2954499 RepID=UPI002096DC3B
MKIGELVAMLRVDRSKFDSDVDGAESKFRGLGGKLKTAGKAIGIGAGAAAGTAIATGIATNLEMGAAQAKLKAQLGATGPEAARLGGIAGRLYSQAYGGSLDEVNQAVRSVTQTIQGMGDASEAELEGVTGKVMSLSTAFDQDLGQTTRAVDKMLRTGLAGSAEEALDILAKGFQNGNDQAGDLLDTFNEYSTMFRELGLDGQTSMGLISQGLAAGARDADKVADAIKEFGIRGRDGSKATAEGFQAIGLNADSMAKRIAAGGTEATDALGMTLDHLRNMEDPVARDAAAVQLFGTQAEDLGDALYALDPQAAVSALGDVAGAAGQTDEALQETAGKTMERVKRGFQTLSAQLVTLPGPFGVASAAIMTAGPAALSVVAPLGTMIAAKRAAAAATVAAGGQMRTSWIKTAASATVNAVKSGAAWALAGGARAAGAVASTAAAGAQLTARWIGIAASTTAQGARAGAAWLATAGANA